MSHTINCSNPTCGRLMDYTPGAFQVICPYCNTWHLAPEDHDEASESFGHKPPMHKFPVPELEPDEEHLPSTIEPELEEPTQEEENLKPSIGYLVSPSGDKFPLKVGVNVIGRLGTDIILNDKTVSRKHCIIEVLEYETEYTYIIYDIGHLGGNASSNGVLTSGRSLRLQDNERIPIRNNSIIQIGNVQLQLKINSLETNQDRTS